MQAFFVIPGDIAQPTGGYGYDRKVLAHAAGSGMDLRHVEIPGGYPFPTAQTLAETGRIIAALPGAAPLLIDGLAYGAMPTDLIGSFGARPVIALCHHPLALEPGLGPEAQIRLRDSERHALALSRSVVVSGALTKRILAEDFGVAPGRVTVALPGTEPAPRAKGSGAATLRVLSIGSVIPRKSYDVLVEAMALNRDLDWQLDIIGSLTHAPDTADAVRKLIQDRDLHNRITLHGARSDGEVAQAYDQADLFVLSSQFEGYGMVIAEAMARGLPIVTTAAGAVIDTLDPRAGIQVPVNAIQVLAKEIREMLVNHGKRSAFADGSWLAGQALPGWSDTARTIADVIRGSME
jgi:glycosyltransferase involved in cell wall biosynthesis